jgi:hypothetical protein
MRTFGPQQGTDFARFEEPLSVFPPCWITSIFGNFEVELQDGRKVDGSFKAKFRNFPKGGVCE